MQFTVTWIHLVLVLAGIILGVAVMRARSKKPPSDRQPLWDQVINSNSDIVTLIGLMGSTALILLMVMSFQDDIKSEAGYIILSALNSFFYLAGVRKGESNGKTP